MAQKPLSLSEIENIRNMFYNQNMSKSDIARETGYAFNTIMKYVPIRGNYRMTNAEAAKLMESKIAEKNQKKTKTQPETKIDKPFVPTKKNQQAEQDLHGSLPEPITWDSSPYKTTNHGTAWVLSDIHFPFHDKAALEIGAKEAKRRNVTAILLNGDIIDCLGLSSKFHKKPSDHMFDVEIEYWLAFIQWLRGMFPKLPIVYKWGNHEERFEHYLAKFPEFFGLKQVQFCNVMEFSKYGVEEVKNGRVVMLGKLPLLHGHEFQAGISQPVNPARGAFMRLYHSVLVGHSHRSSEHPEKDMFDKVVVCTSTGCNCTLKPRYAPYNKWNHGGAFVDVAKDGTYNLHNYKIIEGVLR